MIKNSIEDQSPFIAAVISGLLATAITWALFENLALLFVFIPLSVAMIIMLRFHPIGFIAGLFTDILVASSGHPNAMFLASLAIGVGILLEVGSAIIDGSLQHENILNRSTPMQNSLFAGFGIILNILLLLAVSREFGYFYEFGNIGQNFLNLVDFTMRFLMMPLAKTRTTFFQINENIFSIIMDTRNLHPDYVEMFSRGKISFEGILPIILVIGKGFFLSPPFWAAFGAGLRQIGFRFWNIPILLRQTWKAYLHGSTGILSGFILLLLLIPIIVLPLEYQGVAYLGWISLSYFIFIMRVGRGAQNGL